MKTSRFLFYAFAAAALAACAKEMDSPVAPVEELLVREDATFVLTASTSEMTRTELSSDNKVLWKSGDAISVWESGNASNANVQLTLDSSCAGAAAGDFTGTLTPAGENFTLYAVYPYQSAYGTDPAEVALSIPTAVSQCETVNGLVGVSDFMIGQAALSSSAEKYEMCFQHPLALLDIAIDGTTSILSYAELASLTITANTAFVGAVKADLTAGTLTSTAGDEGKTLTISFASGTTLESVQHAWVAVNPVDLTDAGVCWDLKMTNGQELKFNVNPKMAFEAQKIYHVNLNDFDTRVENYQCTPVYFDLVAANSTAGLPGSNRANCYIVTEPGYYKFAAQKVDKTNCFSGTNPYTNGYTADWLWSTGTSPIVNYVSIGNSGAINFRATGAKGNAVIALYNPDKTIAWSWHIWGSDKDMMTPHNWSRGNTWLVSDINLGATSKADNDPAAYGLYYQWGRKDPFPADKTACVFNTGVEMKGYSSKSSDVVAGAVAYAVAHPTIFLNANDYRTWISNAADAANAQSLWNNTTTKTSKTNYDPCPAGYCIPVNNGYSWGSNFIADNMTWGTAGFTYSKSGCGSTFYPCGGYLNSLALTDAGATARCWAANLSATPTATSNMLGYSLLGTKSTSGIKVNEGSRCAFALNVRCMYIGQ